MRGRRFDLIVMGVLEGLVDCLGVGVFFGFVLDCEFVVSFVGLYTFYKLDDIIFL